MAKLHHVDVANHDFLIEWIAGATIEQTRFSVFLDPRKTFLLSGLIQVIADLLFLDSVEDGGGHSESKCFGSNTEVGFQNLSDIHTARNALWIKHDVDWSSVWQERDGFLGH